MRPITVKSASGRIEFLKIPPILKILILTDCEFPHPKNIHSSMIYLTRIAAPRLRTLPTAPALWIPAFAGMTGLEIGIDGGEIGNDGAATIPFSPNINAP